MAIGHQKLIQNGKDGYLPLFEFESIAAKGRVAYWIYAVSVYVGIAFICFHRVTHLPDAKDEKLIRRWAWIGFFLAEVWYSFYWFITQSLRWNPIYYSTYKHTLSQRYEEVLPNVDILVCTANHEIEPPVMVINTLLSLMAYNYPSEKLNVYLSDDGGSEFMFYALLEASRFSKHWIPFCNEFKIEPRSPAAYFSTVHQPPDDFPSVNHWLSIKQQYEEMTTRIEETMKEGRISEQLRQQHKGFREWDLVSSRRDHQTILQILIDGRDETAVDVQGKVLPTLVYLAREKRPQYLHNFKAGAMNALIRVSSRISNSPIILNVDCDMYSNNSDSVRDALCFLMDEDEGHRIAFVQYPQNFNNITRNDLYSNALLLINGVDFPGMNASGGPMYIGTGCFHKRDALSGMKYNKASKIDWKEKHKSADEGKKNAHLLEETSKILASCTYEQNTQWGKEMGLKYGCPVEDVITGLSMQCRGWKSTYFNPERKGFVGVAPTTLLQTLIQHKRWAEGDFQIFLSKYCPFLLGHGKIPLKLQMSYCNYLLWPPCSLATLFYITAAPFCLIRGISIFPQLSSLWILPYAYIILATCAFSAAELLFSGSTVKGWWNDQRIWLYKRLTSFLFAFTDTILKLLGFAQSGFVITTKVAEEDVSRRYEQEIMEFGATSPMFKVLAAIALFCLFSLASVAERLITDPHRAMVNDLGLQMMLSTSVVIINLPLYHGMFFREDTGRMPFSVTFQSLVLASLAYLLASY